jgi:CheY-like chemotaxis protein
MAQLIRPEIVLLDIEMPKMGGLEVLSEIRKLLPETIVLIKVVPVFKTAV